MWIPDRQHQADIGTSVYMVDWTLKLIEVRLDVAAAKRKISELNRRIKECPRYPGIRLPNQGITQEHMTSAKRRHLLWVAPYIVHGLLDGRDGQLLETVFIGKGHVKVELNLHSVNVLYLCA